MTHDRQRMLAPVAAMMLCFGPLGTTLAQSERVKQLKTETAALDKSVYAAEEQAQRHETAFIRLWDAMRHGDTLKALLAFEFGELVVPEPREHGTFDWGMSTIRELRLTGESHTYSRETLKEKLAALADAGWRLEQGEFHHSKFDPARGEEPARSAVA